MSKLGSSQTLNGINVVCCWETFPKGTPIADVQSGTAIASTSLLTSDGRSVFAGPARFAWCEGACGAEHDNAVYFEVVGEGAAHGWACSKCRKVTQLG